LPDRGIPQTDQLSRSARWLRVLHSTIGFGELACLGYLWFCALVRRRDRWLGASVTILAGEGVALVAAKGCPLGIFQRRAGDDVPMFELWFGRRLAPVAIPMFSCFAVLGVLLLLMRKPNPGRKSGVQIPRVLLNLKQAGNSLSIGNRERNRK
jgi:hypothetical protein